MSQPDVFALKNSALNTFLFASVGTEANGIELTILSLLARLGKDPWAEAALWAKLPASSAADLLAVGIEAMALHPESAQAVKATASRLVELLPKVTLPAEKAGSASSSQASPVGPRWMFACLAAYVVVTSLTAFQNNHMSSKPKTDVIAQVTHASGAPPDKDAGRQ